MPHDDVPATRAEELQGRTQNRNTADRKAIKQNHGLPADAEQDTTHPAPSRTDLEREHRIQATRGPDGRTAKEVAYLARHREHMDNDELQRFLTGESSFHADLDEAEAFTPFSDQEETFLLQHRDADVDMLAEDLERDPAQVRAKLQLMGLEDV